MILAGLNNSYFRVEEVGAAEARLSIMGGSEVDIERARITRAAMNPVRARSHFANVFAALDRLGYDGWVSAEYWPAVSTQSSLAWFPGQW